jgi:hypothetical protein
MSEFVYVTNNFDKELKSEYLYEEFTFPIGKTVKVSVDAARHMLGYGYEDKEKHLAQLGLIRLHSELEEVLEKFKKVEISETYPEKNRSLPSAVGVVPLRVEKHAGGKVNQRVA